MEEEIDEDAELNSVGVDYTVDTIHNMIRGWGTEAGAD